MFPSRSFWFSMLWAWFILWWCIRLYISSSSTSSTSSTSSSFLLIAPLDSSSWFLLLIPPLTRSKSVFRFPECAPFPYSLFLYNSLNTKDITKISIIFRKFKLDYCEPEMERKYVHFFGVFPFIHASPLSFILLFLLHKYVSTFFVYCFLFIVLNLVQLRIYKKSHPHGHIF